MQKHARIYFQDIMCNLTVVRFGQCMHMRSFSRTLLFDARATLRTYGRDKQALVAVVQP